MKISFGVALIATVVIALIVSTINFIVHNPTEVPPKKALSIEQIDSIKISKIVPVQNWTYSQQTDPMTDKETYYAKCTSINLLNFEFPYDGGSSLNITVRKMDGENEVMLILSSGQFNTVYDEPVKIRFDDSPAHTYGYDESGSGRSDVIFLHSPQSIIEKLKTSNIVKIEAPYFHSGKQVANFIAKDFVWKH